MLKTTILLLLFLYSFLLFAQPEYNMQNATVTDCSGILYDSDGENGVYNSDENFTFTICPEPTPTCIQMDFGTVNLEANFDRLEVFDGESINSPKLLFHNDGLQTLPILKAYSGCMTIQFQSDGDTEESGWRANWTCFTEDCPSILNIPNEQDCEGAIPVCQYIHYNEKAYFGEGNLINEIDKSETCLLYGEKNSVWYKLNVQTDGELNFSVTPNDLADDYDWLVFHLTEGSCVEAFSNYRLLVSCNYSSTPGITGATGTTNQTSALGEDNNQNATIPVKKGGVYAINISQYSTSPNGFTIDFSNSTIPIGDESLPIIENHNTFLTGSDEGVLQLNFAEDIQCQSIEELNLSIEGYELTNQTLCNEIGYAQTFTFKIEPDLEIAEHEVLLQGEIADACGNTQTFNQSLILQIDELTDIEDALQSPIRLYPNPSEHSIFVELPDAFHKNAQIEIYNMEGQKLQSVSVLQQNVVEMDVSGFDSGVYYLKVKVGESIWLEKIVVQ